MPNVYTSSKEDQAEVRKAFDILCTKCGKRGLLAVTAPKQFDGYDRSPGHVSITCSGSECKNTWSTDLE
jgi:hypothetical protein